MCVSVLYSYKFCLTYIFSAARVIKSENLLLFSLLNS